MRARMQRGLGLAGAIVLAAALIPLVSAGGATSTGGGARGATVFAISPIVAQQTTGGGASYLRVAVARDGNLFLESPKGAVLTSFLEGYGFCAGSAEQAFAIDMPNSDGDVERGFGPATVTQPTPGAFPVTIRRATTDGRLRLVQKWAKPDTAEKGVTVTMTVTNIGTTTIPQLVLMRIAEANSRYGDPFFRAATSADSVFQRWHAVDPVTPTRGLVATAGTFGKAHDAGLADDIDLPDVCGNYQDDLNELTSGGTRGSGTSSARSRRERPRPSR